MKPNLVCLDREKGSAEVRLWLEISINEKSTAMRLDAYAVNTTDVVKSEFGEEVTYLPSPVVMRTYNEIDGYSQFFLEYFYSLSPQPCVGVEGSNRNNIYVGTSGPITPDQAQIMRRSLTAINNSGRLEGGISFDDAEDPTISENEKKKMLAILAIFQAYKDYSFNISEILSS